MHTRSTANRSLRGSTPFGARHALRAAAATALLFACTSDEDAVVRHDLAERFALAEPQHQVAVLDFSHGDLEAHLLEGWTEPTSNSKRTRWGLAPRSTLRFYVAEPATLRIVARGRPPRIDDSTPQEIELSVNGVAVASGRRQRPPKMQWQIPAKMLVAGQNRLSFAYARQWSPSEYRTGSKDRRPLGLAWEWIRIEGLSPSTAPQLRGDAIVLPLGTQVDYYFWLAGACHGAESLTSGRVGVQGRSGPPGAVTIGSVTSTREAANPILEIEVANDRTGIVSRVPFAPASSASGTTVPLPNMAGAVRISLRARSARPEAKGALRVTGAHVEIPSCNAAKPIEEAATAAKRPNVLLYVVDTLRADRVGVYGDPSAVTPRIDDWAKDATVFERAYANSSWTRPSVASMLTGLDPFGHGVVSPRDALPAEALTLAEQLAAVGYDTAAWVTNPNVIDLFGFAQGFEHFEFLEEDLASNEIFASAAELNTTALAWLARRTSDAPYFLYLHAMDPHSPYTPAARYREQLAANVADPSIGLRESMKAIAKFRRTVTPSTLSDLRALYDAEIAEFDAEFGRLVRELRERGEANDTLMILVADHGEEFLDHGWWGHGKTLYNEQLHVPLIVRFPAGSGAGARVTRRVQLSDVSPTILKAVGLGISTDVQGRPLQRALRGTEIARPTFSLFDRGRRRAASVIDHGFKLVRYDAYHHPLGIRPTLELFDLEADPSETRNLIDEQPVLAGYLRTLLRSAEARKVRLVPERANVDMSIERRLRALGYIQ